MTDESGMLICPGVVPVLVGPLQVLIPILWGLLLAMLGGIVALFKPSSLKNLIKLLWRQKLAVCLLAVAVAGLVYGLRNFLPVSQAGSNEAEKGKDWTVARFNLQRTGAVPDAPTPNVPKLKWNFKDGEEGFFASPAVVGNRVYISSVNLGAFSQSGKIYCFDADTGAVVWSNAPPNYRPTFSSPVVSGNYLVCGEGLHVTRDARVVCLDIRPEAKGKVLWTFATNNHVECTPVVAEGKVFFGAGDDGFYCIDLKAGADGKPKVHWHLPTEQYPDAETSLAVHNGKVYAGLGNDGKALCVIEVASGKELKRVSMPYPVFSPPAIADGKIYLGMGEGDYIKNGTGGEVRCLNLKTLKTEWTFPLEQTVLGAVAVKQDRLYFTCKDGQLYCLSRDGKLVAKFNAHTPIMTSPAVTEDGVFFVSDGGLLFALDRHTLEPSWEFRLGFRGGGDIPPFLSSPVAARGHIYVGSLADGFFCYGEVKNKKNQTPRWANPLGGPGRSGNDDTTPLPEEAGKLWSYPASEKDSPASAASPACWGDDLFVPFRHGKEAGLACVSRRAKGPASPKPRWLFKTADEPRAVAVLDDCVLTIAEQHFSPPLNLICLERSSRAVRWKHPITQPGDAPSHHGLTVADGQVLVQDAANRLTCLDLKGKVAWSTEVGLVRHAPAVGTTMILAATGRKQADAESISAGEPALIALDRMTGKQLWRVKLADSPCTAPVIVKNVVYLGTDAAVEARSLVDGQLTAGWPCAGGPPSAELAIRRKNLYYVNRAGELILADCDTGMVKARVPGALPGFPPLPSRNQALVVMENGLGLVNIEAQEPQMELWLEKSAYGQLAAPPILSRSRVFLPTRTMGLVCVGRKQ